MFISNVARSGEKSVEKYKKEALELSISQIALLFQMEMKFLYENHCCTRQVELKLKFIHQKIEINLELREQTTKVDIPHHFPSQFHHGEG